jgi:hypothetical protein
MRTNPQRHRQRHPQPRFTGTSISRVATYSEAEDHDADGNATSQKKCTDITEIIDNEVIHGTQTPHVSRSPAGSSPITPPRTPTPATHAPAPPYSIRHAQYKVLSDKGKAKHKKYSNILDINNPSKEIKLSF